jgi:murein L,D-transpeptidase YcbB/YkuD
MVRKSWLRHGMIAAAAAIAVPQTAWAEPLEPAQLQTALATQEDGVRTFYAAHDHQPMWFTRQGSLNSAAQALMQLINTAEYDGVVRDRIEANELDAAMRRVEQDPSSAADAELALTRTFVAYIKAMRQVDAAEMLYEHAALQPYVPTSYEVLQGAAKAGSLTQYVERMAWMHPLYAPLRKALLAGGNIDGSTQQAVLTNLERIRAIPASPGARHVLVDAANARLWMYEGDRVVDSMKVVVGKPDQPTPLMSGYIRHAILNPYWNVPSDLVRNRIAPNVLSIGRSYLRERGYQVVSDWSEDAEVIDPATIDWRAVTRGDIELRMRQLPGGTNAMGKVKYEFPNALGIYLHDTPDKNLMDEAARQFSSGCIRLEDADRLGQWLLGSSLPEHSDDPEQKVDLQRPVPIYVTYLTARAEGGTVALAADPYRLDGGLESGSRPALAMRAD